MSSDDEDRGLGLEDKTMPASTTAPGSDDDDDDNEEGDIQRGEDPLEDITDPRETDVLCGRGGAALRHPGNQT